MLCPICYEQPANALTACQHAFCSTCLATWLANHDTCPICRQIVPPALDQFSAVRRIHNVKFPRITKFQKWRSRRWGLFLVIEERILSVRYGSRVYFSISVNKVRNMKTCGNRTHLTVLHRAKSKTLEWNYHDHVARLIGSWFAAAQFDAAVVHREA